MKRSLASFRKYTPIALLSIAALTGEVICDLTQPTLLARMIDEGVTSGDSALVMSLTTRMLLVALIGMLMAISRATLSSHVSQRFGRDLRLTLYEKIQSLSLPQADAFEKASLVTRVTNDVQQMQGFVNGLMRIYVRAPVLCVGSIVMAATRTGRYASVLIVTLPLAALTVAASTKIGYPYFYRVQVALDKLNAVMREYLSGVRVVKAFNTFIREKTRFERANENLTDESRRASQVVACFGPMASLIVNLGTAFAIYWGGVTSGEPGKLVAFINYMTQILLTVSMFSNIFNQLVRALVSSRRIEEVLTADTIGAAYASDTQTSAADTRAIGTEQDALPPIESLEFENVTFSYANASSPSLVGVSFSVVRGESLGIIGSTGSGKSTIMHLIPRLYEISDGSIRVNGMDTREYDVNDLRGIVALAPQESLLFTGSVRENVKWGDADASDDSIVEALTDAQAMPFVARLPGGLDALIGRGGVNISGGQKQRLSIARALVRQRSGILLLDDCTSALDSQTEAALWVSLKRRAAGLILICVSQRIRSVKACDNILVLDEGRVAAIGTHDDLLRRCAVYKDIYESQYGTSAA